LRAIIRENLFAHLTGILDRHLNRLIAIVQRGQLLPSAPVKPFGSRTLSIHKSLEKINALLSPDFDQGGGFAKKVKVIIAMRDSTVHREGRAHNEFSKWVRIDKNEVGAV
jgi:hypothetical protein